MSDQQPITLDLLGHGGELPARGGVRLEDHELQASLQCVGDNLHTIRVDLYHAAVRRTGLQQSACTDSKGQEAKKHAVLHDFKETAT